jgi:hypothetical protein
MSMKGSSIFVSTQCYLRKSQRYTPEITPISNTNIAASLSQNLFYLAAILVFPWYIPYSLTRLWPQTYHFELFRFVGY